LADQKPGIGEGLFEVYASDASEGETGDDRIGECIPHSVAVILFETNALLGLEDMVNEFPSLLADDSGLVEERGIAEVAVHPGGDLRLECG